MVPSLCGGLWMDGGDMSMSDKYTEAQERLNRERSLNLEYAQQVQFERLTVSLISDAQELSQIDKLSSLDVGPVELTSLSNAVTHLQAFILRHRHNQKVAA